MCIASAQAGSQSLHVCPNVVQVAACWSAIIPVLCVNFHCQVATNSSTHSTGAWLKLPCQLLARVHHWHCPVVLRIPAGRPLGVITFSCDRIRQPNSTVLNPAEPLVAVVVARLCEPNWPPSALVGQDTNRSGVSETV